MNETRITVVFHRQTGLVMATAEDLPGFIVHAHSEDEMAAKIGPAFESFMAATGRPVHGVRVDRQEPVPGFGPPAFIAHAVLDDAAT